MNADMLSNLEFDHSEYVRSICLQKNTGQYLKEGNLQKPRIKSGLGYHVNIEYFGEDD